MSISFESIEQKTGEFLLLHWPSIQWGAAPVWTHPWRFHGAMEGGSKQGVYALLSANDEVIYLGVGASLGGGMYEGHGLNARTGKYTRVAPNQTGVPVLERRYVPAEEWRGRGLEAIRTIGFSPEQAYLAYGLEAFLLSAFHPPYNKVRSVRTRNA